MRLARRQTSRPVRAAATLIASTIILFSATAGLAVAAVHTKTCTHINKCATTVSPPPPPPTAIHGQAPPAQAHFGLAVNTPPTATVKSSQQSGHLITDPQLGRNITCGGYHLKAASTLEFMLQTAAPTDITYEVTEMITNTSAQGLHFCLAANFAFKTLSGHPAPSHRLPDGTLGHVGLLPMCPSPLPPAGVASAPCVEEIKTVSDAYVMIKARIPARTKGDPWGAG
jgi:hypothetical protein